MLIAALCAVVPLRGQDALAIDAFVDRLRTSTDVAWLEQIAASAEFLQSEWRRTVVRAAPARHFRADAYVRLGVLATADSLAAIARVEAALAGQRLFADGLDANQAWPGPFVGYADRPVQPAASAIVGQRSYAAVLLETYGPFAVHVLWQDPGAGSRWTRPYLAARPSPLAWSFEPALSPRAGAFVARFTPLRTVPATATPPPSVRIDLARISDDGDGDGWTDFEERHLGLDPTRADTDGDGRRDDVDVSPLYAERPGADRDDEAAILRRALFAHYGLTGSRWAIFVRPGSRALQLEGHAGPVIFGVDLPTRDRVPTPPAIRGGAQASWRVTRPAPDRAEVVFTDSAGAAFHSTSRVIVHRVLGDWVVVRR